MKAKSAARAKPGEPTFGLVANGIAGGWEVAVDETVKGAQRWYVQVDGPSCYVHFQVRHPRIIEQWLAVLKSHLCNDRSRKVASSLSREVEVVLGKFEGTTVTFLWDDVANDRGAILVGGRAEFVARFELDAGSLRAIERALRQVRDELCEEGVLSGKC
ncbi:MAG: hypothetical protein HYX69_00665 [Planctomycetia bacterium]|nr:hypothetical protein [Planctomycetia bacterium]